jgi:hypothetical protein
MIKTFNHRLTQVITQDDTKTDEDFGENVECMSYHDIAVRILRPLGMNTEESMWFMNTNPKGKPPNCYVDRNLNVIAIVDMEPDVEMRIGYGTTYDAENSRQIDNINNTVPLERIPESSLDPDDWRVIQAYRPANSTKGREVGWLASYTWLTKDGPQRISAQKAEKLELFTMSPYVLRSDARSVLYPQTHLFKPIHNS